MGHPIRSIIDIPFACGTMVLNNEAPNTFGESDLIFLIAIKEILCL